MTALVLSALHLIALAIGFTAVIDRAALFHSNAADALKRAFRADVVWALAAGLWIATGLLRLGFEKGADFYLQSTAFHAKMGLLIAIIALETWPMLRLIRFRKMVRQGRTPDAAPCRRIGLISYVQAALVVIMVFLASAMARGY